jgi:nucleoside-diphosphate-sugar epimerase
LHIYWYGVTASEKPPITVNHPRKACDNYSDSKIRAENAIKSSGLPYTILRLSGVVAGLMEMPETLPFRSDQRIEFVHKDDVVNALLAAPTSSETRNQTFNIAGGLSWRMRGRDWINRLSESLGVKVEVKYSQEYTDFDWYDTERPQLILKYQSTTF